MRGVCRFRLGWAATSDARPGGCWILFAVASPQVVLVLPQKQERFARCAGEFMSFAGTRRAQARANDGAGPKGERHGWRESKKRTREKCLPRHSASSAFVPRKIFRLAIHGSVGKLRASGFPTSASARVDGLEAAVCPRPS